MSGLPNGSDQTLAPVRAALSVAAATQAESLRNNARDQAAAVLAAASAEVVRILAAAAADGQAEGRSEAALRSARVRQEAQRIVLLQQETLRRELQTQVRKAATELRRDPRYPQLMARLTEECHALLGPEATVTEDPVGGAVGEAGSRRVDLSLPTLGARTLDSMMREVSRLWTS